MPSKSFLREAPLKSNAPVFDEMFEHAFVDRAAVDARHEILEIRVRPVSLALLDDLLRGLFADAFDAGEPETDRPDSACPCGDRREHSRATRSRPARGPCRPIASHSAMKWETFSELPSSAAEHRRHELHRVVGLQIRRSGN